MTMGNSASPAGTQGVIMGGTASGESVRYRQSIAALGWFMRIDTSNPYSYSSE